MLKASAISFFSIEIKSSLDKPIQFYDLEIFKLKPSYIDKLRDIIQHIISFIYCHKQAPYGRHVVPPFHVALTLAPGN